MVIRTATRRSALAGGAALATLGCGGDPAGVPSGARRVRFATDWRAQAEHGGFYQALATGLYRARGLDVTILQGGPASNVPQLVAAGAVEFGLGSSALQALNLVAARAPVRAVQASFQRDPQVLITHPRGDVRSIADLAGKPVLVSDATVTSWWPWLRQRYGFTDAQIRKYTANLAPFLADPLVAQQGYVTSEPITLRRQGFEPQVFLLADAGWSGYAALTLAPQRLIDEEADVVHAFVDATAEGWAAYLDGDPGPADALIRADNPDMSEEALAAARAALTQYGIVRPAPDSRIGVMSDTRWEQFFAVLTEAGLFPPSLDWRRAYTLQFVS